MLTKRQKEVLGFIKDYSRKNNYAPSLEEIRKHFKFASVSTAHFHVERLKNSGYLQKLRNRARSITISKSGSLVSVPLLGTIAAGEPIAAIQQNESIAVPKAKLPPGGEVYALRVRGNSMIDENIKDGDIVLVKQQTVAENGQRVVALIDGHEATLKKFYQERNRIRLQPANKSMEPIILRSGQDISIQGIVLDVVRKESSTTPKFHFAWMRPAKNPLKRQ